MLTEREVRSSRFKFGERSLGVFVLGGQLAVADASDNRESGSEDRAGDLGDDETIVESFGGNDHGGDCRNRSDCGLEWELQEIQEHQRNRHPHETDRDERDRRQPHHSERSQPNNLGPTSTPSQTPSGIEQKEDDRCDHGAPAGISRRCHDGDGDEEDVNTTLEPTAIRRERLGVIHSVKCTDGPIVAG